MQRIVIVGAPGSGKTTLAQSLGRCLGIAVYERDGLGPLGSPAYRTAVAALLTDEAWIFDGFPYYVDTEVYEAADTVIALDYSRRIVLFRVMRRAVSLARGKEHGAHRQEGIRSWGRNDHAVKVAWAKYGDRKREIHALAARPELTNTPILRLVSPAATTDWLKKVCTGKIGQ